MRYLKNNQGIALVFTLFAFVLMTALGNLFLVRTVNEAKMTQRDSHVAKAFYVAEGGARVGIDALDNLINNYLLNTIANSNPNSVISLTTTYVNNDDGVGWLLYSVRDDNNVPVLLQDGIQAVYSGSGSLGTETYQYDMSIIEKTDPLVVSVNVWDFPYNYVIRSTATVDGVTQNVRISGDFTVRIQRDNFAKYALFTNSQTMPSGTNVWFTSNTNFAGPLHTNGRYNIALNPSGTFQGLVEQQEQLARFYNNGWTVLMDADVNSNKDVPTFNEGFNRGVNAVALASPTQKQDMVDQALGGQTYSTDGIYLSNDGTSLTGGVYVLGDGQISMSVDGSDNAVYTITQGGTTKVVTVDRVGLQTSVEDVGAGTIQTYQGLPDGVDDVGTLIYVDGDISSLAGSVQADTEVTIASDADIVVADHISYANYTAAIGNPGDASYVPPNAMGETNLLGLVSWEGDVRIGTSAPDDVQIHGTIMARNGILQVDSYNNTGVGPRGTATLMGGVITDNYGAFGLFNGRTGQYLSGYGRNFVYDERMGLGSAPPYFPSLDTFIAFTNDISDKLVWQEGFK